MEDESLEVSSSASSNIELLPLEGCSSVVWKYFGFPSRDGKFLELDKKKRTSVHCKICAKVLKYTGNTTNLRYHIQHNHRSEYKNMLEAEAPEKEAARKRAADTVLGDKRQRLIGDCIEMQSPIVRSSPLWNKLTNSICYFIAKDMQPYDTINDVGFRHMITTFQPRYMPPDRKTLATQYIPRMFDTETTRIQQQLSQAEYFAITTDLWTSRSKHAYIGITIHYLTNQFILRNHLLATKEFSDSHTAENLAEILQRLLSEWKLSRDAVSAVTTDNGSNIVLAIDMAGWVRLSCFSHTLQLSVERAMAMPEITKILARCRRLVSHFNHSSKSSYLLKEKQQNLNHKQHNLVQDVATRWNSAYYMVRRVLEQQQPLCATLLELKKGDLMPSDSEFSIMEKYVVVMKPLVEITEVIGAEQWVTISALRPLLHKLLHIHLIAKSTDSKMESALKNTIRSDLQNRYVDDALVFLTKVAFLDPRFKMLGFLNSSEREDVISQVKEEAIALAESVMEQDDSDNAQTSSGTQQTKGEHKLMKLLGDVVQGSTEDQQLTITPFQKASIEINRYNGEVVTELNPLCWWKENLHKYPLLSRLARKYLCIPATSVPTERAFSSAGNIVNAKRSCLQPDSVEMLVFLAENLQ